MSNTKNSEGFTAPNLDQLGDIFQNNLNIYNNFINQFQGMNQSNGKVPFTPQDLFKMIEPTSKNISQGLFKFAEAVAKNPKVYFDEINKWVTQVAALNFYFISKLSGQAADPIVIPSKTDKRFASPEWEKNFFFDFIKQFYLITSRLLENIVNLVDIPDEKQKKLLIFYVKQLNAAFSPTNFVATNPEVLHTTIKEGAQNLIRGFNNFREDFLKHPNKLFISQTTTENFKIGENIANTKGRVIFKNKLFELVHYDASTDQQYAKPLLIVPPFINKFYIMDLNEKKSMMKYLVDNKQNTFLISWKNPEADSRDFGFKDYIEDGVLKAIQVACQETGQDGVNLASYCVGGTLTSMVLAYLKNKKDFNYKVFSSTYFASLVDFTDPGDLGIFINEEQIQSLENRMKQTGYFDGKDMAATFNFLRPGDLYWNYVVNNYLMGQQPAAFDMLYWNSDSTRLPEKLQSDYLRSMYLNNMLVNKEYKLDNKILDLANIDVPMFHVATTEDHIAPWKSVFMGIKNYKGACKFILANSGHIAGIIQGSDNKPGKLYYFENDSGSLEDSDNWLQSSEKKDGSWWPMWMKWMQKYSGDLKNVSEINLNKFKELYKAPGQYVVQK